MKKLLREPLLHFLLLGLALFVAHRFASRRVIDKPGIILVTQGQIASMAVGFSRTWQRSPTQQELEGLIRDWVREEVYYREGLAMGLDRDDTIIRRRLRQKMEFVTDDITALAEPTDAELTAYLQAHPDLFHLERRFTFSQVYLNPDKHRERLGQDTVQLLAELQLKGDAADFSSIGDSFLLEHKFDAAPSSEIAKQFGEKFAAKLSEIPEGRWYGPIESGYGEHLIFLNERTGGRLPELAEVRDAVHREWANARRLESNEKFYQEILKRYAVSVEKPKPAETEKKVARAE